MSDLGFLSGFRFGRLVGLLLCLLCGIACEKAKVLEIDSHFSYNLIKAPLWFPDPEAAKFEPGEQEVFDKRGRPDFFRLYWRPDGSPITSRDLSGQKPGDIAQRLQGSKKSWIYINDNEEVVFLRNGASYRVQPVDEKLKLLCTYGDPSNMSQPVIRDGNTHEYWQWIEHGLQVELVDGVEVKRTFFKPTGAGTYLLK